LAAFAIAVSTSLNETEPPNCEFIAVMSSALKPTLKPPRPVPLGRFDAELKPLVARSSTFPAAPPVAFAPNCLFSSTKLSF
jgi:hypothetical protein